MRIRIRIQEVKNRRKCAKKLKKNWREKIQLKFKTLLKSVIGNYRYRYKTNLIFLSAGAEMAYYNDAVLVVWVFNVHVIEFLFSFLRFLRF